MFVYIICKILIGNKNIENLDLMNVSLISLEKKVFNSVIFKNSIHIFMYKCKYDLKKKL